MMIVVAGPPGVGKTTRFLVSTLGVDSFNLAVDDTRTERLAVPQYDPQLDAICQDLFECAHKPRHMEEPKTHNCQAPPLVLDHVKGDLLGRPPRHDGCRWTTPNQVRRRYEQLCGKRHFKH